VKQLFFKYFIQSLVLSILPFFIGLFMLFMVGLQSQPVVGIELFGNIALIFLFSPILFFLRGAILFYKNTAYTPVSKNKRIFITVLLFLSFSSPLIFYWLPESLIMLFTKFAVK